MNYIDLTKRDLNAKKGPELVKIYNDLAKSLDMSPVKRFSNWETAVRRTWDIVQKWQALPHNQSQAPRPEKPETAPKKPETAPAPKKPETAPAPKKAGKGTNIQPGTGKPVACREGTKQAILVDELARPEGATMDDLLEALSGGRKPWTETSVRAGFSWDVKNKGYGVRSETVDGVVRFFLVLPKDENGNEYPIPAHRPAKAQPKNDARQGKLDGV